jgi:hypothetical protein
LVEPIQIRFLVGNPFLDRLPRWLDGLEGFDVEGRFGRRRDIDDRGGPLDILAGLPISGMPQCIEVRQGVDADVRRLVAWGGFEKVVAADGRIARVGKSGDFRLEFRGGFSGRYGTPLALAKVGPANNANSDLRP